MEQEMRQMTEKSCANCEHAVPRDRREDFGDVCELWCAKGHGWCDWRGDRVCGTHVMSFEEALGVRNG